MRKLIIPLLLFACLNGYGQKDTIITNIPLIKGFFSGDVLPNKIAPNKGYQINRPIRFIVDTPFTGHDVIISHSFNTVYWDSGRLVAYNLCDTCPTVVKDSAGLIRVLQYIVAANNKKIRLLDATEEMLCYIRLDGSITNYKKFTAAGKKYLLIKKENP